MSCSQKTPAFIRPTFIKTFSMTPQDRKIWQLFIQYVTPLKRSQKVPLPKTSPIHPQSRPLPKPTPHPTTSVLSPRPPPLRETLLLPEPILAPLDRKLHRDRVTGRKPLAGTLDLHGMTQDQAYQALQSFLDRAFHDQRRFVLIITGKGKSTNPHGPDIGVLKRNLPIWLNNPTRFPYILFLKPAARIDGGDGAWYVGLKKNKSQRYP